MELVHISAGFHSLARPKLPLIHENSGNYKQFLPKFTTFSHQVAS